MLRFRRRNYAVSHSDMGDVSRARSLFVEVLDVRRATLGPEHQVR